MPSLEYNLTVNGRLQVNDILAQGIHKIVSYFHHLKPRPIKPKNSKVSLFLKIGCHWDDVNFDIHFMTYIARPIGILHGKGNHICFSYIIPQLPQIHKPQSI